MRRRQRVLSLARARLDNRVRELKSKPPGEWPEHAHLAFDLLSQLGVPEEIARQIIIDSRKAAHVCARGIDRQATNAARKRTRDKLCAAFRHIGNCAARGSANLRRELDGVVASIARRDAVDLDDMEELLAVVGETFEKYRDEKAAKTALRAMLSNIRDDEKAAETALRSMSSNITEGRPKFGIVTDYAVLGRDDQQRLETELKAGKSPRRASDVFLNFALALASDRMKADSQIHALITDYVVELIGIWRKVGLSPSRAVRRWDSDYKSKFHRYADLILTFATEPWARRHGHDLEEAAERQRIHAALPPELKPYVSASLPRRDVEWLVADHHVQKALKRVRKSDIDTPYLGSDGLRY